MNAQDSTNGRFAVAVRSGNEGVLGELRIARRSRVVKLADILNRDDLLEHSTAPAAHTVTPL
jgi:hypothetical protein